MNLDVIKKLKPQDIIKILEDYRLSKKIILAKKDPTILISLKIPESLLNEFREKCESNKIKYQTQIKILMKKWLSGE